MNIIDFLVEDHVQLRANLALLGRLSPQDFERRFMSFLRYFEIHEDIEEEILYPRLDSYQSEDGGGLGFDYERDHTEMWRRLGLLKEAFRIGGVRERRKYFENLQKYAEGHMKCEEEILFPLLRKRLPKRELDQMGIEAERKMDEFFALFKKSATAKEVSR